MHEAFLFDMEIVYGGYLYIDVLLYIGDLCNTLIMLCWDNLWLLGTLCYLSLSYHPFQLLMKPLPLWSQCH